MKEKISKLINVYKKYGFKIFIKKLYVYIKANYFDKISFKVLFKKKHYRQQIIDILSSNYDRIILWRSSFGYNVPLFQRPQHIANNLARQKSLVFYEVTSMTDKIKTFKKISENLYLFNFNNIALNKILMEELNKLNTNKYIQLYSTDWKLSVEDIRKYINKGFEFMYEYIDDISPVLSGTKEIPRNIIEKYEYVMSNKNTFVVVTADLLKEDVENKRGNEKLVFSSNGVDCAHFRNIDKDFEFDEEFNKILQEKKPIIGYYGALAAWFDYEIIKYLASKRPEYNIVLLGIEYDESYKLSSISEIKNVHFLGSRNYNILKNYADKFDVCTIPFLINDITKSTSPVKLFEYMALKKPIVTTQMNECKKYNSVMIAKNKDEFVELIDYALTLDNKENKDYFQLLYKEANENSWEMKARAIIDALKKYE